MSSPPTLLTVTGLLCCLLLVCHAQDTVDCDAERAKCPGLVRLLTPDDLDRTCSLQAARKSCFEALSAKCQAPSLSDSLDAVDYICQPSVVDKMRTGLKNCVMPNQKTIDDLYDACAEKEFKSSSGLCLQDIGRKCALEALNSCCPALCEYQDIYIYNFYKSTPSAVSNCPWSRLSGYCNLPRMTCAPPA